MERDTCPLCSQAISRSDTVRSDGFAWVHLDCQNPQALTAKDRALLAYYCWDHVVGNCSACSSHFRLREIAQDFLNNSTYLCPHCCEDRTDSVREHLYACAMPTVRRKAQDTCEISRILVKQSRELCDAADVLVREVEAALGQIQKGKQRSRNETN
jgi:hypothetical protein